MSITKSRFDSIPDSTDDSRLGAWEECILKIVDDFSLTARQYQLIEGRYATIARIFEDPDNPDLADSTFFTQGSFLTHTVIKPPSGGDIDVDAVVWSPNHARLSAEELFDAVHEELDDRVRTEQGVEAKNRCIRVLYADETPSFHLDVTPAVNSAGNEQSNGQGKLCVPDKKAIRAGGEGWKPSAPKEFAKWVDDSSKLQIVLRKALDSTFTRDIRAGTEPLPDKADLDRFDPLRATIKLLKFHREKFFDGRRDAEFKPISVLLTTLAGKAYAAVAARSVGQPMTPIQAIIAIIDELPRQFDEATSTVRFRLCNPTFRTENFAERWNDVADGAKRVEAFGVWHRQIQMDIRLGLKAFDSREEFTRSVSDAFGVRGTQAMLDSLLESAANSGFPVAGLSAAAIQALIQPSALAKGLGIGTSRPQQNVASLGRLG